MANRFFSQYVANYQQDVVEIYAQFDIGASGAVTAGTVKGPGLASVVKESADGQYSLTFSDQFPKLLWVEAQPFYTTATNVAAVSILEDPVNIESEVLADKTVKIQFYDFDGAAVDAPSGSRVLVKATFRNSSVDTGY